jgi:anaerobic selenocysteine-containing dehydrogenase
MTVRSEGQFNTVVYEEYDLYRGQDRRDVVLVHPDDLARMGLKTETLVCVRSEAGQMRVLARAYERIKPGNVLMYYPEANVLVPGHCDPASRTPAFKNVAVTVEAAGSSGPSVATAIRREAESVDTGTETSRGNMRAC